MCAETEKQRTRKPKGSVDSRARCRRDCRGERQRVPIPSSWVCLLYLLNAGGKMRRVPPRGEKVERPKCETGHTSDKESRRTGHGPDRRKRHRNPRRHHLSLLPQIPRSHGRRTTSSRRLCAGGDNTMPGPRRPGQVGTTSRHAWSTHWISEGSGIRGIQLGDGPTFLIATAQTCRPSTLRILEHWPSLRVPRMI